MIEFQTPYRGFKTSDGRIFTGQPVQSMVDRHLVTVCASHDAAKRAALEHEQSLREQSEG